MREEFQGHGQRHYAQEGFYSFMDDSLRSFIDSDTKPGILNKVACSVLMQVLCRARAARFDLLKVVQGLAAKVSKWTLACDSDLFQLMSYINTTADMKMQGYIGDRPKDLKIRIYADADFASDADAKSVSGVFEVLVGPNTWFPLHARSSKQGSVAHCTPEAEIVAIDTAIQKTGMPAMDLWNTVLQRTVEIEYMEDNAAKDSLFATCVAYSEGR